MVLGKAGLLEEMALLKEEVTIRNGKKVIVTELSAEDYMAAYESTLSKDASGEFSSVRFSALMAVRSMVDETGQRIMQDEDAEPFRKGSSGIFKKITAAVNRLNAMTGDEVKN